MTEAYAVVIGEAEHIKEIHGVYTYEERADLAAEELGRMYEESYEWVDVRPHEIIAEPVHQAQEGGQ